MQNLTELKSKKQRAAGGWFPGAKVGGGETLAKWCKLSVIRWASSRGLMCSRWLPRAGEGPGGPTCSRWLPRAGEDCRENLDVLPTTATDVHPRWTMCELTLLWETLCKVYVDQTIPRIPSTYTMLYVNHISRKLKNSRATKQKRDVHLKAQIILTHPHETLRLKNEG